MNIEQLRKELEVDEGVKYEIYNDHLGYPTFGIGHLVRDNDPENGEPVGTPVSEDRVIEAFNEDVETVLNDCTILYDDFDDLPEEAQLIIANMMFNLGRPRLSRFLKMKQHVDNRDFVSASEEMKNSKWYRQVTNRAQRLCDRMANITT